jgi:hypothetical protein
MNSGVISEGTNIDLLAEACLTGFRFEALVANALIGSAARPFGLDGIGSRMSGEPPRLRRNFAALSRLRLAVFCFATDILRPGPKAAGVIPVMAK